MFWSPRTTFDGMHERTWRLQQPVRDLDHSKEHIAVRRIFLTWIFIIRNKRILLINSERIASPHAVLATVLYDIFCLPCCPTYHSYMLRFRVSVRIGMCFQILWSYNFLYIYFVAIFLFNLFSFEFFTRPIKLLFFKELLQLLQHGMESFRYRVPFKQVFFSRPQKSVKQKTNHRKKISEKNNTTALLQNNFL